MKTRNGFVSNSSSSSFVVCFPKTPKTLLELHKMLFGQKTYFNNPYTFSSDDPGSFSSLDISERVWKDFQGQKPMTLAKIAEQISEHTTGGYQLEIEPPPEYPRWPILPKSLTMEERAAHPLTIEYRKKFDEYEASYKSWSKKAAKEFTSKQKGKYYCFSYDDHSGPMITAMEHGNLFEKLHFVRISNH